MAAASLWDDRVGAIPPEMLVLRADSILDQTRQAMVRTLDRRLADPEYRTAFATAIVGLVLP